MKKLFLLFVVNRKFMKLMFPFSFLEGEKKTFPSSGYGRMVYFSLPAKEKKEKNK